MQTARVIGYTTATMKHPSLTGWKLVILQPLDINDVMVLTGGNSRYIQEVCDTFRNYAKESAVPMNLSISTYTSTDSYGNSDKKLDFLITMMISR
jgi:hypothetical protein